MSVQKIDGAQFNEAIAAGVAVVDFNATWCGPCKMLGPVLEKVSETFADKAKFYALDVDDNPEIAQKYRVASIPYVAVFKDGEKIAENVGFVPEETLAGFIQGHLN